MRALSFTYLSRRLRVIAACIIPVLLLSAVMCLGLCESAVAGETFGDIADRVTGTFGQVAKMITATAYVAGLGFAIGAILKFKQHKDNPTQIPVGTPIAMLFIAAALIFLPSILGMTGASLFSSGGTVGGPTGVIFS